METASAPAHDPEPQPPLEPEPGACCQSGCNPCVYDQYWDACERYATALLQWRARRAPKG